jgi:outer membrane protein assembly factor BamD
MRIRLILAILFVMATMFSCKYKAGKQVSVDQAMGQAMKYYNKGRYVDAIDRFTRMSLDFAGSALMDSISYMEAECQFQMKEYLLAADQFEIVISRYPSSPLIDEARIRVADSYYELSPKFSLDQTFTYQAIGEYQSLLDDYPDSDQREKAENRLDLCRNKLSRKDLHTAELYYKMSLWPSTILYVDEILENWYDQPATMEEALYLKAITQDKMKRTADARATMEEFLATYPDSDRANEIEQLLASQE